MAFDFWYRRLIF